MFPPRNLVRAGAVPTLPTEALPGSEEKIRVMMLRAAQRQQLFHPLDGPRARRLRSSLAETALLVPTREMPLDVADKNSDEPIPQGEVIPADACQSVHALIEV